MVQPGHVLDRIPGRQGLYSATAGANFDLASGAFTSAPNPFINEFKWGAKEPSVEIQLKNCTGYQAWPFSVQKALSQDVK